MNEDALKLAGVTLPMEMELEMAMALMRKVSATGRPSGARRTPLVLGGKVAPVTAPVSEQLLQAQARIAELEQALADLVEAVRDSMDSEG